MKSAGVGTRVVARVRGGDVVLGMFLALALTWGASFLFTKIALEGLSPVQVVTARLTLGAIALIAIMTLGRYPWPRDVRVWGHLVVLGVLFCVAPFLLFAWAGTHLPSGVSSIYNATTPLMTMIVATALLPNERITRVQLMGLAVGAIGVMLILAPWHLLADREAFRGTGLAQLACLGATFCYGIGITYTRRFVAPLGYQALPLAAGQITSGAVVMLVLSPFLARGEVEVTPRIAGSLLVLGMLGTGVAYIWNTRVIQSWGATASSTVTYLTPVVGVVLGILVLDERLAWTDPVGAVIVFAGILIGQGRLRLGRR